MCEPGRLSVLAVTYADRVPANDRLYAALAERVRLTRLRVDRTEARHLKGVLGEFDLFDYDRIVVELRAKHALPQWRYLRTVPNLVFYEEDTWQNYVRFSHNRGRFLRYYRKALPLRILHSGYTVAERTRQYGFDSRFLPKGYDGGVLWDMGIPRDIELAFVGSLRHRVYRYRRAWLEQLGRLEPLQLLRSSSVEEYRQLLNRIRYFISADIDFGEHMIKNFEAMACGCVLFAYRQGQDDDRLGLRDMHNMVAYSTMEELRAKLNRLRGDPALGAAIAARGRVLAERQHEHRVLAERYFELLREPLTVPERATRLTTLPTLDKVMSPAIRRRLSTSDETATGDGRRADELEYRFLPAPRSVAQKLWPERYRWVRRIRAGQDTDIAPQALSAWGRVAGDGAQWVAWRRPTGASGEY